MRRFGPGDVWLSLLVGVVLGCLLVFFLPQVFQVVGVLVAGVAVLAFGVTLGATLTRRFGNMVSFSDDHPIIRLLRAFVSTDSAAPPPADSWRSMLVPEAQKLFRSVATGWVIFRVFLLSLSVASVAITLAVAGIQQRQAMSLELQNERIRSQNSLLAAQVVLAEGDLVRSLDQVRSARAELQRGLLMIQPVVEALQEPWPRRGTEHFAEAFCRLVPSECEERLLNLFFPISAETTSPDALIQLMRTLAVGEIPSLFVSAIGASALPPGLDRAAYAELVAENLGVCGIGQEALALGRAYGDLLHLHVTTKGGLSALTTLQAVARGTYATSTDGITLSLIPGRTLVEAATDHLTPVALGAALELGLLYDPQDRIEVRLMPDNDEDLQPGYVYFGEPFILSRDHAESDAVGRLPGFFLNLNELIAPNRRGPPAMMLTAQYVLLVADLYTLTAGRLESAYRACGDRIENLESILSVVRQSQLR